PRERDPDRPARIRPQELDVPHLHGPRPADRPDHTRNRVLVARAVDCDPGFVEVDAVERCREAVRIALTPHLAVADHVDARLLHVSDRQQRRVVLSLFQEPLVHPPELSRAHARRRAGAAAVSAVGDVRSPADVRGLVELASSKFGGLDVMVANAAVSIYTNLEEQDEETIDLVLDTDLKGAILCAQASIPAMRERGGGSIVLLSSVQGYVTLPGCVPYAAAKAGLVAAARALAVEVGSDG